MGRSLFSTFFIIIYESCLYVIFKADCCTSHEKSQGGTQWVCGSRRIVRRGNPGSNPPAVLINFFTPPCMRLSEDTLKSGEVKDQT